MKTALSLLISISSILTFAQNSITVSTPIFADGLTEIVTCDSIGQNWNTLSNADEQRIYLLDVRACDGNRKMKGSLLCVMQKDDQIFYSPFLSSIGSGEFNYSYIEVEYAFKDFKTDERKAYEYNTRSSCNKYYAELRFKEAEEERIRQEEENRRREEQIRIEKQKQAEIARRNKEIAQKDSTLAVAAHIALLDEEEQFKQVKESVNQILQKGINGGGILIHKFEVDGSYGSTSVSLGIFNCTKKRIKYAQFTLKALNDVNDQVGRIETVKGIGFIEPSAAGEWEFEDIWFSNIIGSVSISSIKLTFEDGTSKVISNVGPIRIDNYSRDFANDMEMVKLGDELRTIPSQIIGPVRVYTFSDSSALITFDHLYTGEYNSIEVNDNTFFNELSGIIDDMNAGLENSGRGRFKFVAASKNIYMYSDNGQYTVLQLHEAIEMKNAVAKQ